MDAKDLKNILQGHGTDSEQANNMNNEKTQPVSSDEAPPEVYLPIDSYGLIGNMKTSALVGTNGSIDWCCFPHFNSPSVFARVLDFNKGGHFSVKCNTPGVTTKQHYWPDTNLLVTRFLTGEGVGQLVDFMPVIRGGATSNYFPKKHKKEESGLISSCSNLSEGDLAPTPGSTNVTPSTPSGGTSSYAFLSDKTPKQLSTPPLSAQKEAQNYDYIVRRLEVVHGHLDFTMECFPAFNFARDEHSIDVSKSSKRVIFRSKNMSCQLDSSVPIKEVKREKNQGDCGSGAVSQFSLSEGSTVTFIFKQIKLAPNARVINTLEGEEKDQIKPSKLVDWLFIKTVNYWHSWLKQCTYQGRYREMVHRSVLALKLMTFSPTGAIVASPTCSLPEHIGGVRNWDYRYTWLRDASFTLYSFLRIGFTEEAKQFMLYLEARCHEMTKEEADEDDPTPPLQIMYGIDGSHHLQEEELHHLSGYKNSKPVRIGNGAYNQLQLDVYGELMDAVYLYNKYGSPISYDLWTYLRKIVNWVCKNWHRADEGVWEVRGGKQHFLYSKVMCWVALDRAIRLADKRSFPSNREVWLKTRDNIYEDIMKNGWNEDLQAFVQYYGSDTLDASALILPLVLFCSPTDPRMLKTIDAINKPPNKGGLVSSSLVYRYDVSKTDDGFGGSDEGTFNMCTFWLIEALTRAGRTDKKRLLESQLMFEQMMTYSNHLGLYSEEMSFGGVALGNFPQAFTHLAVISAAFNLNRCLDNQAPDLL